METLLIGDSLGNVLQGHESTLPVTLRDIVYHTQCVARGSKRAFIIGDMPFGTFQISPQETLRNAAEIMAAGAHMVKLEGGRPMLDTMRVPHRARHTGVRPPRAHAAVGAPARRLQGAGQGRDRRAAPAAGSEAARGGGRRHDRARGDTRCARGARSRAALHDPDHRHRRRRRTARARCSCSTTCSTSSPAGRRSSSRTTCALAGIGPGRGRALREGSEGQDFPGPEHSFSACGSVHRTRHSSLSASATDGHHPFRLRLRERLQREPNNVFVPTMGNLHDGPHPADQASPSRARRARW